MNKITAIFLAVLLVAGSASAGTIWENNFNSANTFFDPVSNPVDMHNGRDDAWLGAGTILINASDQLVIKSGGSGQTRGLVRALTTNTTALVDTTGDASFYRFSFDIININATTDFNVNFLKGIRDADGSNPESNTYNIDLLSAIGADLTHTITGSGTLTTLIDNTYTSVSNGTTVSFDFEYDGIGDLVMVFDATGNNGVGWERYTTTDNWKLEVVPAPLFNPSNLVVAAGDGNAFIAWATNSELNVASYSIYRSTVSGSYGAPLATNITAGEYFDDTVTNGTPYYYVVTAADADGGESGFSNEDSGIPMAYPIYSMKKGVGNSSKYKHLQKQRVEGLHASWYYAWSMDRNFKMNANIEFVPMRHNKWWPDMAELAGCGTFSHLLTYNEPDHGAANQPTVQEALDFWPEFESAATTYGCEISSPACSGVYGNDGQWVTNFMTQAVAGGLQVDFMAYHRYPNPNGLANAIRSDCDTLWATYGKPIWVTEFNGADWAGSGSWSMVDTYTTMIELLYYFESTSYVERYAVFPWDATWAAGAPSHVFEVEVVGSETNTTSILTPLGKLYAEYRSVDTNGPYADTWYHLHNKGSKERLMNDVGTPVMTNIYTDGTDVQFEIADAGGGNSHIINRTSGDQLGYNGVSLFWTNSTVSGSAVEWTLSDNIDGWDLIDHPDTGERLSGNPLSMVSSSTTDNTVRWSFVRSTPLSTDIDSDELPDSWEVSQFGSLVSSEGGEDNFDGDVHTDWEEYIAGTLAADSNSFFQSSVTDAGVGTLEVSFDGVSSRIYVLETTESLTSNVWTVADTVGPLSTNGVQVLQYADPGDPDALFGRVRVSL